MFRARLPRLSPGLALCALFALLVPSAGALQWPDELDLTGLTAEASLIVRGTITEVRVQSVHIGTELPALFSAIDIEVERGFVGAPDTSGEIVTVFQVGGELPDGYGFDIAGTPFFAVGEEVVLFSNDADYPAFAAIRADQGTWRTAWWNGRRLVLGADWVPKTLSPSTGQLGLARCVVAEGAENVCRRWADADGNDVAGPVHAGYEELLMTVEDLDVLIEDLLPATSPTPAQVYTDEATYAADLAAFFTRLNRTQVPADAAGLDETTDATGGDPTGAP